MCRNSNCLTKQDSRRHYRVSFGSAFVAGPLQRELDRRPRLRKIADAVDSEGWRVVALLRFWSPIATVIQNYVVRAYSNWLLAIYIGNPIFLDSPDWGVHFPGSVKSHRASRGQFVDIESCAGGGSGPQCHCCCSLDREENTKGTWASQLGR